MKKIIKLVLALCLLISISACHGQMIEEDYTVENSMFVVPENFDTSKEYEITFWSKNDSNRAQSNVYKNAISEFESLYPNIHVTLKSYTDYLKIYNDVITNISTNTTPNVCITYPDNIATYITGKDVVVPLDSLISDKKYGLGGSELKFDGVTKDEIVERFLSEGILNDMYYDLPFMRSTEALYINKTFVEKLGYKIPETVTWDFIWEVSKKALEKNDEGNYIVNNQKIMIPFIYKSTDNMMIQIAKQLDLGYSDDEGNVYLFNDETSKVLEDINKQAIEGTFSTFKVSSYPANYLNAGQCIFAIDSTAGATWMGCSAPNLDIAEENIVEFETEVKVIPQYDVNNPKMISQGPSICIFNKEDDGEVLASWLFAQYLLTNEVQIAYAKTEGYVPVTLKAQNDPLYKEYLSKKGQNNGAYYSVKLDATELLINNIENTFVTPVFNGSTSLRNAAGQLIEIAVTLAKRNTEFSATSAYEEVNSLYRLDQLNKNQSATSSDLGPLPVQSKALLISLSVVWVVLGVIYLASLKRNKS